VTSDFDTRRSAGQTEQVAKRAVDFSIQYVGLEDIEVYREWSAAVPEVLRDLVDGAIFDLSKDMLETEANEGGAE
jgi:hypothetical protein